MSPRIARRSACPSRYRISRHAEYADTVYLGAWPRRVFEEIGGFNEALAVNEDYEFSYRIRKAGGQIYLTPDIYSEYYGRQTLGALWRQFFRYGRWKLRMLAKHPASVRPRQIIAPAFVAALIGGALLALLHPWFAWLWGLTLLSYGMANLAASIQQASPRRLGPPAPSARRVCLHPSQLGQRFFDRSRAADRGKAVNPDTR